VTACSSGAAPPRLGSGQAGGGTGHVVGSLAVHGGPSPARLPGQPAPTGWRARLDRHQPPPGRRRLAARRRQGERPWNTNGCSTSRYSTTSEARVLERQLPSRPSSRRRACRPPPARGLLVVEYHAGIRTPAWERCRPGSSRATAAVPTDQRQAPARAARARRTRCARTGLHRRAVGDAVQQVVGVVGPRSSQRRLTASAHRRAVPRGRSLEAAGRAHELHAQVRVGQRPGRSARRRPPVASAPQSGVAATPASHRGRGHDGWHAEWICSSTGAGSPRARREQVAARAARRRRRSPPLAIGPVNVTPVAPNSRAQRPALPVRRRERLADAHEAASGAHSRW